MVLTGCESVSTALETTNAVLGATNSVLGAATGTSYSSSSRSSSSYSRSPHPTAEQQLKIDNLAFKASNAQIQRAIAEAKPNIQKILRETSCFNNKALTPYLTSKANSGGSAWFSRLSWKFNHHPENKCVDVAKVYGWKMPAKNILDFVAVYSSEISGETTSVQIRMEKEDGEWLLDNYGGL